MAELVVTSPDGSVVRYRMGPVMFLGRHPECQVVLSDPMSSRKHCKIELANGAYFVEDCGSANGTMLNGAPLQTRQPMKIGDCIQIGYTRLDLRPDMPQAMRAPAVSDPNLSIVRVKEDLEEQEPGIEYAVAAGGDAITEEEQSSSDLTQLKRVTQRLKLLVEMGQTLGSSLDPRKTLQACLDRLFDVFPQAERGFILLYGPEGDIPSELAPVAEGEAALAERRGPLSVSKIRNPELAASNEVQVSRTVVKRVREQRQTVLVSDSDNAGDGEFSPALSMARLEIRSVICSPLVAGKEDLGILYVDAKDPSRRFTPDDVGLFNALAGQAAVVIKNAELARNAAAEAAKRENLQRFLAPDLVEQILKKDLNLALGGEKKHGTVFFSDIVGFTRIASQMDAADVVALLNRYFKVMQEIIFARGGTVDKFNGDQIMAFWGVLVDVPQSEAAAVTAAVEMQNAMYVLNRDLARAPDIAQPPEPLGQGIGLNTGEFVAGNIGGERKIEFTVIGNAVNLAQRVESIAGRGQVFIGQGTYDAIQHRALAFRMPDCPVKNVSEPLKVYSIRGIVPPGILEGARHVARPDRQTSRLDPVGEELLASLPCRLAVAGQVPVPAVVTNLVVRQKERTARLDVFAEQPVPAGARLKLEWTLAECAGLSPVEATVTSSLLRPASLGEPGEPGDGSSHSLLGMRRLEGSMTLEAEALPDDLLTFKAGTLIDSTLKSSDEIERV